MSKYIERQINNLYWKVFKKVFSASRLSALSKGSRIEIIEAVAILDSSEDYIKFATKFAKELAKKGLSHKRGLWRKYYAAAKKLHYVGLPTTWAQFEMMTLSRATAHNFTMIKSIPSKMLELMKHKYISTLIEEVAKGKLSRNSFRTQLEKHGIKNAKLIARTETAKLQTAITEYRAKNVGSVAYIWRSSNDMRTRKSHKDMNDVIVFWRHDSQKPLIDKMRGNAGEFPNCRCTALPIVDIDDLTQTTYKVYNYNTDSVQSISRKKLVESIEKGELQL